MPDIALRIAKYANYRYGEQLARQFGLTISDKKSDDPLQLILTPERLQLHQLSKASFAPLFVDFISNFSFFLSRKLTP